MPAASGCITSRLRSSLWIWRVISRRCLRFISCQWCCVGWLVALLFCSSGLDFMLTFLCQIQLGSARLAKTTQSPQRGRAVLLCRTTPATIYTIARTGAMLLVGQERSREKAALAAEPGCASDFTGPHHNWRALGRSFRLIQPPQSGGRCSYLSSSSSFICAPLRRKGQDFFRVRRDPSTISTGAGSAHTGSAHTLRFYR